MQNTTITLSNVPEEIRQTHLDWLRTQFPHGTYFKQSHRYIISHHPPTPFKDTNIMKKSQILRLISSIASQLAYHQNHPTAPSAPPFFTPDDIITTYQGFMISPDKFLPIIDSNTITLYNLPPFTLNTSQYIPPNITTIPAILSPQSTYYCLGQLVATLWKKSDSPEMSRIDKKIAQFIHHATVEMSNDRQLIWAKS